MVKEIAVASILPPLPPVSPQKTAAVPTAAELPTPSLPPRNLQKLAEQVLGKVGLHLTSAIIFVELFGCGVGYLILLVRACIRKRHDCARAPTLPIYKPEDQS